MAELNKSELDKLNKMAASLMGRCYHEGTYICNACGAPQPSQGGDYTAYTFYSWDNPNYVGNRDVAHVLVRKFQFDTTMHTALSKLASLERLRNGDISPTGVAWSSTTYVMASALVQTLSALVAGDKMTLEEAEEIITRGG